MSHFRKEPLMKYKVYAVRTETCVAEVEAKSKYEAVQLVEASHCDYDWKAIDGTLDTEIDKAEEIKDYEFNK